LIPLELIDTADLPDGGTLRLMRRGQDHMILFGRNELMSSRLRGSEEALATLSYARLDERPRPHMLVGGLGMGFTLRAALAVAPADARITVGELVPKIVEWARGPLAHLFEARPWVVRDGPERIESGWWDGGDVRRDYFVADTPDGSSTAWIYRDHRYGIDDGEWFLHGLFA